MSDARQALLHRIEADQDRLAGFLQAFTRIDTCNQPGDTRAGAAFVQAFFDTAGLPYRCRTSSPRRASTVWESTSS